MNSEKSLKRYEVFSYAFGEFTFSLMMWITIAYLSYYFTDVAKIAAVTVGTIMLITHIADMVTVPLAGSIIQKLRMRWGQFRSWLLFMPVITFIFFSLLFAPLGSFSYGVKCILIVIFYFCAHVSINFAYIGFTAQMEPTSELVESLLKMISYTPAFVCLVAALMMGFYRLNDQTVTAYMKKNAEQIKSEAV